MEAMGVDASAAGTRLTLDLWHPDCWAIRATDDHAGGILAHAVYDDATMADSEMNGLFTAYADTEREVEELLDAVAASPLTDDVRELQTQFDTRPYRIAPGAVTREFFVGYDTSNTICPLLLEHGFVHSAPGRIEDGREYWDVRYVGERGDIEAALDRIREEGDADIDVDRIGSLGTEATGPRRLDALTPSQREAFELARDRGYYEWPREASTRELADELGVSKTTLLEHLRTAESKLLDP
jgi:predicted DNA binding protein